MLRYLLRRILFFIPTLIIITLLAFVISASAPGDPVSQILRTSESAEAFAGAGTAQHQQAQLWIHRLGLDLPLFYFSVTPSSFPDTLYRIYNKKEKNAVKSLLMRYGNTGSVESFHFSVKEFQRTVSKSFADSAEQMRFSRQDITASLNQSAYIGAQLLSAFDPGFIANKIQEAKALTGKYPFLGEAHATANEMEERFNAMEATPERWRNFIPSIHFHDSNQYHRWLFGDGQWLTGKGAVNSKGLIRGDFGISLVTQMPVSTVIWKRIGWSLLFTFLSVIFAYLISIPIGVRAAAGQGLFFDRASSVTLFFLHSMPAFWVATLLLVVFANPDVLPWFPASGVKPATGYPGGASFLQKVQITIPYLILPLIAYTYSSLAFLSRLTRTSMLEVLHQDFIKTARAKGLSERRVIWHHAYRNALLPLITVFANILPAAIGGAVIIESIFTIPGMGLETYQAIQRQDYPMIIGVFTMAGVLTMIGYLLADVLYALADPRISFAQK
jgi:peptide/nickel transport system permease protein